jgi:hypothetical protein
LVLALAAVVAVFFTVGAVGAAILFRKSGRDKAETDGVPPVAAVDPSKTDAKSASAKNKPDPPPAKDLEVLEKYLPDDAGLVAVFDVKQWLGSLTVRQVVIPPLSERLAEFRRGTGVDLLSTVERVVVVRASDAQAGTVVVLQGRGLVTPRLIEGVMALPGVRSEPAFEGGTDVALLPGDSPAGAVYAAATETSIILSAHRERVVEALEKRDGKKRTRFDDPTIARGIEFAFARPFAAFVTIGLRKGFAKDVPAAGKVKFAAAGLTFDERGMEFITLADETEPGKAAELQKAIGLFWAAVAWSSKPPDPRLERIARLFLDAESPRSVFPRLKFYQTHYTVPTRTLEDWLAPFFRTDGG